MKPAWTPAENNGRKCLNCGASVSSDFCRVFGDQQHRAHACRNCTSMTEINRGAAAGLEIAYDPRGDDPLLTDGGDQDD